MIKTQKRFRFKNPHYFSVKTYEIKKLDKNLTLFLPHFSKRIPFKNSIVAQKRRNLICKNRTANPYQYFKNKALKKYVILGIGGNLEKCAGDCIMRFWQLLRCLKNKNVILIDDIMTTGATISECKYILKKSGVKQIIVLTIAKSNI